MTISHWKADPRQESYDRVRTQIVRAAHELLIVGGRTRLHIGELAGVCGLARPTIYRYFGDKQELITAVQVMDVESLADEFRNEIRRVDGPAEQLVEGLLMMVAYMQGRSSIGSGRRPGGQVRRDRTPSCRARSALAQALVRPLLELLPLSFEDTDHERRTALWLSGILTSLVDGALSELDPPEEIRRQLRQFVVPSVGLAVVPKPERGTS